MIKNVQCYTALVAIGAFLAGCNANLPLENGSLPISNQANSNRLNGQNYSDTTITHQIAQARQLERSGHLVEAIQSYVRIAEYSPGDALVWHRLAVSYDKVGRAEYAASCYERALALDAANPELICDFGYSQFLKGNLVSAEQLCRRALNLNPNLQRAHNNLGLILAQTGKPEAAIQQFQMAGCDMTQAQQNLELVRQSARAHGITPTALPDIVQGQAVAQAPMRRTSLPTSAAPSVAINAPTAPAEDAPMSGLQPAAAQASSTVALKPMPQSRSPSYSTTVAQVESKPVAMTFSAPAVASESLQRPAPAQPKVAAAHQPASTNSPPALKSEAIATTQGQPTKVPSSPIARLNYYATDPTAAPPSQPTRAIGSALATPSSAGNPPQEFARPAKATRVGSTDSTAGVKLTLSSGEEVEKIESKKPATPRSGVERKLGDLD